MSSSALYRWAGLANIAAAILVVAGRILHPADQAANVVTSAWVTAHILTLVAILVGIPGVFGVYIRQARSTGGLGFLGFLLIFLGLGGFLGIVYFEAFINPVLATEAPSFLEKQFSGQLPGALNTILPVTGIAFALGWLLFGIGTYRASILPRWSAVLAFIGAIPLGLRPFFPGSVVTIGTVIFGLGILWLGYALISGKEMPRPA